MADYEFYERFEERHLKRGHLKYACPFKAVGSAAESLSLVGFGPYKDIEDNWQYSSGLHMNAEFESQDRWLYAMTIGTIEYQKNVTDEDDPGTIILQRADGIGQAISKEIGSLPHWYPQPRYIIYENVDRVDAKNAILKTLSDARTKAVILQRLRKIKGISFNANAMELAEIWLNGEISVQVRGGDLVGGCGVDANSTGNNRFSNVRMLDTNEHLQSGILNFNPSYYIAHWKFMGWIVGTNDLLEKLSDTSGPPAGTGQMLFVVKNGATESIDELISISTSITTAIGLANDFDTIVINDQETYFESIVIERPIFLMGASTKSVRDVNPSFLNMTDYPTIDGDNLVRPIVFRNVPSTALNGMAYVGKINIFQGKAPTNGDNDRGDGGGILVEHTNRVVISSCMVRRCSAVRGEDSDSESSEGALFSSGFGGGINAYHSSPLIIGCKIEQNNASDRGKGIGVWGYGWPAIINCVIRDNGQSSKAGRSDGGGIAIQIAVPNTEAVGTLASVDRLSLSNVFDQKDLRLARKICVRIFGCHIKEHSVKDDGGGIYLTVGSKVAIRRSKIEMNKSISNGGGIRASFGSWLYLNECEILNNESNTLKSPTTKSSGGGIAARNVHIVSLKKTIVNNNTAHGFAGGGLSFITTDAGKIADFIDYDSNDFLWDQDIYNFTEAKLKIDSKSSFVGNQATKLGGQASDHGKGGAIYVLRWRGLRSVNIPIPGQPVTDMILRGTLVRIHISDDTSLSLSNSASFPNSNQLYLSDLAVTTNGVIRDDRNLTFSGARFTFP